MSPETLKLLEKLAAIAYGAKPHISPAAAFPNEYVKRQYIEIVGQLLRFAPKEDITAAIKALREGIA